jgi:hypothetical protein
MKTKSYIVSSVVIVVTVTFTYLFIGKAIGGNGPTAVACSVTSVPYTCPGSDTQYKADCDGAEASSGGNAGVAGPSGPTGYNTTTQSASSVCGQWENVWCSNAQYTDCTSDTQICQTQKNE